MGVGKKWRSCEIRIWQRGLQCTQEQRAEDGAQNGAALLCTPVPLFLLGRESLEPARMTV